MLILYSTMYNKNSRLVPDDLICPESPQSTAPWRDSNSPQKLYYFIVMTQHPSQDECRCTTCGKLSVTQETCGRHSYAWAGNMLEGRLTCLTMFPQVNREGVHCVSGVQDTMGTQHSPEFKLLSGYLVCCVCWVSLSHEVHPESNSSHYSFGTGCTSKIRKIPRRKNCPVYLCGHYLTCPKIVWLLWVQTKWDERIFLLIVYAT